ncbi:Carboxyl/Cholinesterase 36 [Frankliniella occidentalis]|uniref:Juvenile hormone esterase-like n=1 Tax=Frankliniella occidentalis TaxID=133901 RepID=A0A6J1S805_FRAOC|nr:juvenile hormone esterase-like [Frankliniella occidentalis]KAE8743191.1 Carboxyl/Cholinesterase 36 [Frankliniella occidentalis]
MHNPRTMRFAAAAVACILVGAGVGAGVFFILRHSFPNNPECKEPMATVESGALRGLCRPERLGHSKYAAFLGVPYAKPPLKDLRFKSPRPPEPWSGVRDALMVSARCTQGDVDKQIGSEDCLYLNVYSPRLEQNQKQELLPVLVHVHGGAMKEGSGTYIRPDYFVDQGIVVVTFNYRLSNYGFLNLDTDDAPGNAALKDIIAALKWIKRNIRNFGGDPEKVTINGCSSAAVLVHWLCLLPDTEGLFRAAIIKSGSALVSWGYSEQHRPYAEAAVKFMQQWAPGADAKVLLQNSPSLLLDLAFTYASLHNMVTSPENAAHPYVSLEKRSGGEEPTLIVRDPESYVLRPERSSVPKLMGITSCEYEPMGDMYFMLGELPPTIIREMVPRSMIPMQDARRELGIESYSLTYDDETADLRAVLFNLTAVDPTCNIICRWERYFSDTYISVDTVRALRMHAQRDPDTPTYAFYSEFPIDGSCGTGAPSGGGTLHAHDDKLVWPETLDNVLAWNTSDPRSLTILRQVTAFGNFVKFGKPVPKTDPVVLTTEWQPMGKEGPDVFMRFNANWTMDSGDMLGRFGPMWKQLYDKYRYGKGI